MAANNLRQLRTAQGLSQAKLADRAGTSAQQIDRLEKGERKLTVEWLTRLAGALDVQPHEIFMDGAASAGAASAAPPRIARPAEPAPMLQKDLPVYGTALGADLEFVSLEGHPVAIEQTMLNQAETIDTIRRLPALQDERDAYAIYVQGSSMEPAFEDGDPVPSCPVARCARAIMSSSTSSAPTATRARNRRRCC